MFPSGRSRSRLVALAAAVQLGIIVAGLLLDHAVLGFLFHEELGPVLYVLLLVVLSSFVAARLVYRFTLDAAFASLTAVGTTVFLSPLLWVHLAGAMECACS